MVPTDHVFLVLLRLLQKIFANANKDTFICGICGVCLCWLVFVVYNSIVG